LTPGPLSAALHERFISRGEVDFAAKALPDKQFQLGGHVEREADGAGNMEMPELGS
jgi:6-phosphogluconate dehydrogenase (decarboxylating)